ncbi:hypothetical protein WS68_13215 [Burkholderia sp. TSV86]|nr:hypothetical protein WS68_13215 [Burkholderia sp. TSV86]
MPSDCQAARTCVTFDASPFTSFALIAMNPSLPARAVFQPSTARLACVHRPPAAPPPVGAPPSVALPG